MTYSKLNTKPIDNLKIGNTFYKISEHKDICSGEHIDQYPKPKIEEFLLLVAEFVDFNSSFNILESQKRW